MDLIAAGSHGHNFVERLLIGSVATKLLPIGAVLDAPRARLCDGG